MSSFMRIANITWKEHMEYRLNFIMWRVRNILRLVTVYFLWAAVYNQNYQISGYSKTEMLTYILGTSIISSLVFSTRTQDVGDEINSGDLNNLLLRPINSFYYWLARDVGDKITNIVFALIEIVILIMLLKPPLFIQTNLITLIMFTVAVTSSIILYFMISIIISFFGFWTPNIWGPRFLMFIIMEFLAGGLFPLNILPEWLFKIISLLPFGYLMYFPLQIYLGRVEIDVFYLDLTKGIIWIIILTLVTTIMWRKGLRSYEAYGR